MIEHRTRISFAAALLAAMAAAGAAHAAGAGDWVVERDGNTAVATRTGPLELTSEGALAKEADAAVRAATGCGIAGMGPTTATKAQFKALLDCKAKG